MRRVATLIGVALAGMTACAVVVLAHHQNPLTSVTIYDSNPTHLWNRLYAALLIRQDHHGRLFGEDSLDPLLWQESDHLLSEPSHRHAIETLDEFLSTHGETLVRDPLKRVVMARDLWAVFDWSNSQYSAREKPEYDKQKQELQSRLAEVMRRIALTPNEIKSLPDTYAQAVASGTFGKAYDAEHPDVPFLPPDLFDPRGPWVCITPSPESDTGVAPMHLVNFSGRSGFLVFVRLPEGRKATYDYFQTLWNFPQPYVQGPSFADDQAPINPDLPSFPAGTQVALVRRLTVFDNQGNLTESAITESVQIRVYRSISTAEERNFGSGRMSDVARSSGQEFFEMKLSRPLLFAGKNGGFRATVRDERTLPTFQQQGDDLIDEPRDPHPREIPTDLQSCVWCHNGGGVRSLNSRPALLKPNRRQQEPRSVDYGPIYWSDGAALGWKSNHFDWGLLNGYWRTMPPQ
ncbi:MAG TPA: hypothetical protein VMH04_24395 [Candidatus Solibacter sp.]|nr:hypothetical protein [Candidatus Solibacter sp.]